VLRNFEGRLYRYPQPAEEYVPDVREIEVINF